MIDVELSVVILCYRTGERIRGFAGKVLDLLKQNLTSWEIVLVANYLDADDRTPHVVAELALADERIKTLTLVKEGMMGWDARSGMSKARGRYICLIDGDEQMPPEDIIRVYKKAKETGADLVMTNRVKRHDGVLRTINSRAYNWFSRKMFPEIRVHDINSKPKIMKKELYDKLCLGSNDWFLDAEILIKASKLGARIIEIPTEFYRCVFRRSFIKLHTISEFVRNIFSAKFHPDKRGS